MELHQEKNTIGVKFVDQQDGGVHIKNKEMEVQLRIDEGDFSLLGARNLEHTGCIYDKPLSCFGCGIGWFLFLVGFLFPPLWYYATILFWGNYYLKDPRERPGLAASAIAALVCSVAILISLLAVFGSRFSQS